MDPETNQTEEYQGTKTSEGTPGAGSWVFLLFVVLLALGIALTVHTLDSVPAPHRKGAITVSYPKPDSVFPRDIIAPQIQWTDGSSAGFWRISIEFEDGARPVVSLSRVPVWRPSPAQWKTIKERSLERRAVLRVSGITDPVSGQILSESTQSFRTSADPVGARIFYREVPLPVAKARAKLELIRWRLGDVSTDEAPKVVLSNLYTCSNCHSFSRNGQIFAMDLDHGLDRGGYLIAPVRKVVVFSVADIISWNSYPAKKAHGNSGFLSQVSPDGRYVASTVKDEGFNQTFPDLYVTQLFFAMQGIIAWYDRESKRISALPGADLPEYVQTNPVWAPDNRSLLFCRGPAYLFEDTTDRRRYMHLLRKAGEEFLNGRKLRFEIYRVPFNDGKGGVAEPLPGASGNGKSNFFPRFSPDGKWLVFCQADSFMLNQPDSDLYIMPASGGTPVRLSCSTPGRMDSWHSWSPNGKWLVFASKADTPYTQLYLTHIDADGRDSPPIRLQNFVPPQKAANIPEFVADGAGAFEQILPPPEIRNFRGNRPGIVDRLLRPFRRKTYTR